MSGELWRRCRGIRMKTGATLGKWMSGGQMRCRQRIFQSGFRHHEHRAGNGAVGRLLRGLLCGLAAVIIAMLSRGRCRCVARRGRHGRTHAKRHQHHRHKDQKFPDHGHQARLLRLPIYAQAGRADYRPTRRALHRLGRSLVTRQTLLPMQSSSSLQPS